MNQWPKLEVEGGEDSKDGQESYRVYVDGIVVFEGAWPLPGGNDFKKLMKSLKVEYRHYVGVFKGRKFIPDE